MRFDPRKWDSNANQIPRASGPCPSSPPEHGSVRLRGCAGGSAHRKDNDLNRILCSICSRSLRTFQDGSAIGIEPAAAWTVIGRVATHVDD